MFNIDFKFLEGLHQPAPRYTSYPTALEWEPSDEAPARVALQRIKKFSPTFVFVFPHSLLPIDVSVLWMYCDSQPQRRDC